jgi:hypothetical protein
MSLRIMFDSNAYDRVINRSGLLNRLERAVADGAIDLVRTHVQVQELQAIPDPVKRAAALAVPGRYVPAGAMLWGVSCFGDRFGGGAGESLFGTSTTMGVANILATPSSR